MQSYATIYWIRKDNVHMHCSFMLLMFMLSISMQLYVCWNFDRLLHFTSRVTWTRWRWFWQSMSSQFLILTSFWMT